MRRNGWYAALSRIATASNCYVYVWSQSEETFSGEDLRTRSKWFRVGLGVVVSRNMASPLGVRLYSSDFRSKRNTVVLLWTSNFGRDNALAGGHTVETACRKYLEMNAGRTMGICDYMKNRRSGYIEERFVPTAKIPEFGSLAELNLRLDAEGKCL